MADQDNPISFILVPIKSSYAAFYY